MIAHTSKNLSDVGAEKRTQSVTVSDEEMRNVVRWQNVYGHEVIGIRAGRVYTADGMWTMDEVRKMVDDCDAEDAAYLDSLDKYGA